MSGPLNSNKLATPDLGVSPEAQSSEPAENQNQWGAGPPANPQGGCARRWSFPQWAPPPCPHRPQPTQAARQAEEAQLGPRAMAVWPALLLAQHSSRCRLWHWHDGGGTFHRLDTWNPGAGARMGFPVGPALREAAACYFLQTGAGWLCREGLPAWQDTDTVGPGGGGDVQSFPWVKAWVGGEQRAAAEVSPVRLCPTNTLPASL